MRNRARAGLLPVSSRLLGPAEDQYDELTRWVAEVASPSDSLLDIGAGSGDNAYLGRIRPLVARVVGLDPHPYASVHEAFDDWYEMTVESFAPGPGPFDLALAVYVVEHVTEPAAFFRAARACLRPGGSLFVITPNLWHYFGLLAKSVAFLGLEDRLLRVLRAAHPGQEGTAHFAVAYRANSLRALRRLGAEAGFSALEVRHLDNPAVFETYFPGRLVGVPRWYSRSVHRLGRGQLFGTLICRLVN